MMYAPSSSLTGKTIGVATSVGTNPHFCNNGTNNGTETPPLLERLWNRQTTSNSGEFVSTELSDHTAKWLVVNIMHRA